MFTTNITTRPGVVLSLVFIISARAPRTMAYSQKEYPTYRASSERLWRKTLIRVVVRMKSARKDIPTGAEMSHYSSFIASAFGRGAASQLRCTPISEVERVDIVAKLEDHGSLS